MASVDNPSAPTQLKASYNCSIGYPSGMQVIYRRTAGRITGIDVQPPPNSSGKAQPVAPFCPTSLTPHWTSPSDQRACALCTLACPSVQIEVAAER